MRNKKVIKGVVSVIVSIALLFLQTNPVIGEILPPNSSVTNRPTINNYQTPRGAVPVVNIVNPNANGLSHNKYDRFDIDKQGAVLNNATQNTYSQIIGEQVSANTKLTNPAKVILNEVLSAKSNIFGSLEVLGQKADVIIANAYGISVNGGNFINTGKVSLITGNPIGNSTNKYKMGTGYLEILQEGLTSDGDINLVSRQIGIRGEIKAKELQLQAGNDEYDIEENKISSQASKKEEITAIDISSSMYADRIRIINSKKANTIEIRKEANLISNAEDIEIDAQGKVRVRGMIESKRDIKLKGETIINEGGEIKAENDIEIKANVLENKSVVDNLKYEKEKVVTNAGRPNVPGEVLKEYEIVKSFSYKRKGEIEAGNKVSINSQELRNIGSKIKAEDIEINSKKLINEIKYDELRIPLLYTYSIFRRHFLHEAIIKVGEQTREEEKEIQIQNQGKITGKNIKITSDEITSRSSKIEAKEKLDIAAKNINNVVADGQMLDIKNVKVGGDIARGGYRILNKEVVEMIYKPLPSEMTGKEINLHAQEILNESSIIQAVEKLKIKGNNLTNTNKMVSYDSKYQYQIKGAGGRYWDGPFGGWKEDVYHQEHTILYPNIYTSKTAGKLQGGEIEINLSGKLSLEEYDITKPIIRPNDEITGKKVISTIEADKLKVKAKEVTNSGMIKTKNDFVVEAEQNFTNNDGVLIGASIDITTGKDFISRALVNYTDYNTSTFKIKTPSINASGIILTTTGKLNINSQGNIDVKSTSIFSNDDINLTAQKISLTSLTYDKFHWKVDFKKSYDMLENKEGEIAGTMLSYGSVAFNGLRDIVGYTVVANRNIDIKSEEDITIKNQVTKEQLEIIRKHSGGWYDTSSTDIYKKQKLSNIRSTLEAGGDITLTAGNNIVIKGSSLKSENGTITLTAGQDIDIFGVLDYEQEEHYREESGTLGLSGSSKEEINVKTSLVESVLKARGGINIFSGNDTNIFGTSILSDENIIIQALNNINIGSIEEWSYNYYHKESKGFNFGDFFTSLAMSPFSAVTGMIDSGKYRLFELSYDMSERLKGKTNITNKASNIVSKGTLKLEGKELTVKASNITANDIEKNVEKINIINGQDKETQITEKKDTKVKVGAEISNAFLNAYKSLDNVTKAGEAQARAESELSRIEELHKQGKASDSALKQAQDNVTVSRFNIAFLSTMAAGTVLGSVESAGTLGFGIASTITFETKEEKKKQETITSIASKLIAKENIIINTNEYNQIGSLVTSLSGDIFINAGKANISASKDTYSSTTESKAYTMSATYGTNGTFGAIGYNQSNQEQYVEKYNNSLIQADNGKVVINTTKDTTLKGANVKGKDVNITAENLTIESLQDKSRTTGSSFGMNVGAGKSKDGLSGTAGFERGNADNERAWVNNQSSIIASENLNIKVKDTTNVKGAIIASETDNLTLNTGKLVYSDIKDYDMQNGSSFGLSASLGQYDNDSFLRTGLPVDATGAKVTLKEQGKEKEQTTKATIGKGTIIVGGKEQTSEDLKDLNRDTTKTQELTKDQITAALDADINVDIKLLTSLFDAAYNGDVNKISVVKDYKKAKKEINEIKQKIQEKLKSKKEEIVKQRKQELKDQIKEQKYSLNEEQDKKIKEEIADNDEVLGLKRSIDNLKKVEDYVKENNIKDKKEIEKYKRLAVENVEIVKDKESGELYMITNYAREYTSEETTIGIGLERVSIKITAEVLNEARQGRAQDKLAEQITLAANAINESINKYSIQGINYGLSNFSSDTDSSLPIAQIGFDILGIVPVVGVLGDYVSYKISEHYNDETGMFLSLVGMTDIYPQAVVAGTAGSVAKTAKDVAKSAKAIEKLIKTISKDGGKTAELAIKTAKKADKLAKKEANKVNFYVTPEGTAISTAQKDVDNLVSKLDIYTPTDKAVFYSGGEINKNTAKDFSRRNKLLTIEDTSGGIWLQKQQLYGNIYRIDSVSKTADMYWGSLSAKYANQASGKVHAFVERADKNRVFWQIEYPTLQTNPNINEIYFYDKGENIIKWENLKQ